MKFACPKCSTRYSITEARIPPDKTLRFACKICSGVIRLRRKAESEEAGKRGVAGVHSPPHKAPPTPPSDAMVQWFVILSGTQKGPIPGQDIIELLRHNHVDRRSYAWRDGMNEWARLGSIPEFADLANNVGDANWRLISPGAGESGETITPPHFDPASETMAASKPHSASLSEEEQAQKQKKKAAEFAQLYGEHQQLEAEALTEAKELETQEKLLEAEAQAELERLKSDQLFFQEEERRLMLEQEGLKHDTLEAEQRTLDSEHSQQAKELREEELHLQREQEASEMSDAPPPDDDLHEILIEDEQLFDQSNLAHKEGFSLKSTPEAAEEEAPKESLTFENLFFEDQFESEQETQEQELPGEETNDLITQQKLLEQELLNKEEHKEANEEVTEDLVDEDEAPEDLVDEDEAPEDLGNEDEVPEDQAPHLVTEKEQGEQLEQELQEEEEDEEQSPNLIAEEEQSEQELLPKKDNYILSPPSFNQTETIAPGPSSLEAMFDDLETESHPPDSRSETPPKLHGFIEASEIDTSSYFRTSLDSASILSTPNIGHSPRSARKTPMARPIASSYQARSRIITGLSTVLIVGSVLLFASALNQVSEISRTSYEEAPSSEVTEALSGEAPSLKEQPSSTSKPKKPILFPQSPLVGGSITGLATGETPEPTDAPAESTLKVSPLPPPGGAEGSPSLEAPPEPQSPPSEPAETPENLTPAPEPAAAPEPLPELMESPEAKEERLRKRQELRRKLLGIAPSLSVPDLDTPVDSDVDTIAPSAPPPSALLKPSDTSRGSKQAAGVSQTIEHPQPSSPLSPIDEEKASELFNDDRKREQKMTLEKPRELRTPNLPDGLTTEALLKVISSNSVSIKLCLDQALRKGEKPKGRLNIRVLIKPTGMVDKVDIEAPKMKSPTMIKCARKRIQLWRFPRFAGEPVPVEFPYLLSTGY